MITGLGSQSKFQMFTFLSGRHVGVTSSFTNMAAPFKFVQNISPNIWSLGERTDLKLGELSYFFIPYSIIIFWLWTLNGFR